ncbi:hypothetical protein FQR65_LT08629 [Abscondita terminalis]|nr:hypothetical protein FQR65_LT08629 [Abscondita terminalis]
MISKNRIEEKKYYYTKDNDYLTNQQRDFYEENGYLIVRNLVDSDLIDQCRQRFVDMCNKKVRTKGVSAMKDPHLKKLNVQGEPAISRIQNIYYDDVLSKYVTYKPTLDVVQSIIGPNITCCHSMLINKPPNTDENCSRHPLHQDLFFFPYRPDNSLVVCWTAMETVTKQNGCLFVVPKSHKMGLQSHDYPPVMYPYLCVQMLLCMFQNVENRFFFGVLDADKYVPVYLPMEKGDTIFFHTLLYHGSGPNLTKGYRKSLSCHYVNSNATFFMETKNKEKLFEKDIIEKWGYGKISFEEFWKQKCLLVRGSPGKLQGFGSRL